MQLFMRQRHARRSEPQIFARRHGLLSLIIAGALVTSEHAPPRLRPYRACSRRGALRHHYGLLAMGGRIDEHGSCE
jgi:hypothetical protein